MKDFRAKMDKLGIPKDLGQKNSQALKWLNKNSKLKYVPLSDELLEVEKSMGIHGSSKADKYFKRPERRIALSQRLFKIQEWAHEKFGKKTTMPKLEGIVNKLKDIPLIAKKGTDFLMKLGFRMTLGPSMIGADLMTEEAAGPIAEILSDKKEPLTYRGGGMANINTMTAPLGYYRGGPARAPESYEGFEPIHTGYAEAIANMNNPEYANKWNLTKPRQPGLDEKLMQDYEPPIPRWGKARELGKKGLEGIKGLGLKSIDVLRKLLGSKAAEAGTYIPDSVLEEMTIEELVKEIQLFDIGLFGNPVRPNDISHLRELTDALEKQMGKYK